MYARLHRDRSILPFFFFFNFRPPRLITGTAYQRICELDVGFGTYMTDLRRMGTEAGLRGETLAADVAVERPVLRPLHLSVVIPQVLLQIRQLDEGPPAVR